MKHSKTNKLLSLVMAILMVVAMFPVTAFAAEGETAELVNDISALAAGDKVVIVAADSEAALGTNQKSNNRGEAAVTKSGTTVTLSGDVQVLTLEAGSVDGTFAFDTGSGYLYAAGKSKAQGESKNQNYLRTEETLSANSSWKIEITDGIASVVAQGENGCNIMQYNKQNALFSAYSSAQQEISIYKIVESSGSETPEEPEVPAGTVYGLVEEIREGDTVVMYNANSGTLVSSAASGYKLAGVAAVPEENAITTAEETVAWVVGKDGSGNWTFTQGDKVLGMVQSGNYVNLSTNAADGNTAWTLESSATENVYYLRNTNMPAGNYGPYYLEYYSGWTAYASSSPSDAAYGITFYAVEREEEPEVQYAEKMTSLPGNGDVVVIYNSGNAMGSEASGKKLSAIEAAVSENKLALAEGMAQLLVTVEDGNYIFTLDGKYLTSAETGNGLSFADELTDCGKWTVEEAVEGAWYIRNVGANYNGNYNQAMEYYYGFTTYGIKETEIYQMQFFLVSEGDDVHEDNDVPDGDYVIWAPAYNMSLSSEYTGYYNKGVEVTEKDGKLSGYGSTEVWTVTNNDDGTISLSFGGKNLAMADSYSSLTLGEKNDKWVLEDAGNGLYYVKNAVRGAYIEWYAAKSNWSGYAYINSGSEGLFALKFTPAEEVEDSNLPSEGDKVVIYNLSAQGVLGAENDVQSINNVSALAWTDDETGKDVASVEDGAVIFTVFQNGGYYRFYNETYGWLCSNGTGNNAFYTQEASEDADWLLLEGKSGGWNLESRTAKYNGTYSQYLEYYADSYKTYSMYNVTDYDIYEFFFYPVDDTFVSIVGDIVHAPDAEREADNAYIGQDWKVVITVKARLGVKYDELYLNDGYGDVRIPLTEEHYTVSRSAGESVYEITVPAEMVKAIYDGQAENLEEGWNAEIGIDLYCEFEGVDHSLNYGFGKEIIDEPSVGEVTPAANAQTGDDKRPVISAEIFNAGADAAVTMTVNGEPVDAVYDGEKVTYTPSADLAEGRTVVNVTVVRADGKETSENWSFIVGEAQYELYFGQLHSHTTYSDGSGSLEAALDYILNLPESANVDFVAFTDHSNYFDASGAANPEDALYDMSLATENSQNLWSEYKGTIAEFNASQSSVVAIGGFEMTWSGGPGHINTFNTEGIVSRNNTTLNNKTNDAGMKAYYALLSQTEGVDSISQFNHPGSTFGTFTDFAYWDAVIDSRIYLVEVGNGEGQIGAGGYYPSYEYYTMALDKGWHVAPTNNQDNHKGKWGNANDARDVIITDDFSEEGIYEAIRALRMYSTEDKNLEIGYTVNGLMLGSSITEVPEKLNIEVTVYDPDNADSISKVEVIVNSGKVAYTWDDPAELAAGVLSAELDPDYSYYYIRVTEGDGDLAVTAPVWVGESLKLGISSVETTTTTPVTGEELTITTTLFNSENTEATVKSLTYTTNGSQTVGLDVTGYTLPASGTLTVDFAYTPEAAKLTTVTVTAVVVLEGVEYVFTMDIDLDVQDAGKLVYVGIDASHYNEYVNGNYKDNMGNFSQLAAEYGVRTVTIYESEDLIAACSNPKYKALILTAPSRRSSEAQSSDPLKVYTDEEIAAIKEFNANGGIVILAGWSDHYENYPAVESIANMKAEEHMAATQNAVLEALGSSLRIGDDATYDDDYNGGQAYRLYFNTYGESFLTEGVEVDPENPHDRLYTEVFSHYGGASVYTVDGTLPSTVAPVVFGHSGTYSVDVDKDGLGGESMYKYTSPEGDERLMIMAYEQLEGQGLIIVSGAAFMSNFEVQATIEDSGSEKNYSNYKICENLLAYINPVTVTDIAEVRAQTETGYKYTIEGVVTSNASGYDKNTAFFDCIYVQDATGGICCFPVAGNYKIGDKVRITGTTEFYQGEPELQVTSIELIGEDTVEAKEVTAKEINDRSVEGQLVTVKGEVKGFEYANGLVQTIMVKDANGDVARVFIDGYITIDKDVENLKVGAEITVTGLASYDDTFNAPEGPFPRIRIRDRADVVCTAGSGSEGGSAGSTHKHDWTKWEDKGAYSERTCPDCGFIERVYTGRTDGEGNPETGAPVKATSAVSAIAVLAAAAIVLGKRK